MIRDRLARLVQLQTDQDPKWRLHFLSQAGPAVRGGLNVHYVPEIQSPIGFGVIAEPWFGDLSLQNAAQ